MAREIVEGLVGRDQTQFDLMAPDERVNYAWLAGIIDGEGSISLTHSWNRTNKCQQWDLVLCVTITHRPTIERIKHITHVGNVYGQLPRGLSKRYLYRWMCSANKAGSVLRLCVPFMTTKRRQAEIALEFIGLKHLAGHTRTGRPVSLMQEERRRALVKAMSNLNKTGEEKGC